MPKTLTLKDLNETKNHGHKWDWAQSKMPDKKYTNKTLSFKLTCTSCKTQHWVNYSNLKRGLSKSCKNCSKLPTIEKMRELIEKFNMLWSPSMLHKNVGGSRAYRMLCGGCSEHHWVRWQRFTQGRVRSCKKCSKRLACGSISDPYKYYKHPIMAAWRKIRSGPAGDTSKRGWGSFENFKAWSLNNGFIMSTNPVLKKLSQDRPNTPDNCYWEGTRDNNKNTVKISGY